MHRCICTHTIPILKKGINKAAAASPSGYLSVVADIVRRSSDGGGGGGGRGGGVVILSGVNKHAKACSLHIAYIPDQQTVTWREIYTQ